jgi:DNA-binding NtrC family response regulator
MAYGTQYAMTWMRQWSVCMGEHSAGGAAVRPIIEQGTDGATLLLGAEEALLRGTETILFVEDQSFVREVTGKILKSAGYRVLVAKSAAEASRAYELASGGVELLLTDVVLPRENGQELARELRRHNPVLRVLLITGYAERMVKMENECEFGRWLAKPFSARTLLRRVREVLDGQSLNLQQMSPIRIMRACSGE